jgi:hypothetical protein
MTIKNHRSYAVDLRNRIFRHFFVYIFLCLITKSGITTYVNAQTSNKLFQNEVELRKRLSKTYLFADSAFVRSSKNTGLKISSPTQFIEVLKPEKAWEKLGLGFGTVLKEKGEYRMYYQCHDEKANRIWCMATSKDGLKWVRPNLGIVNYQGSTANNILSMDVFEVGNLFKRVIDGKVQYVTMVMKRDYKHYFYTSPDGVHFTFEPNPVMPYCADTQNQIFYDSNKNKYIWYLRSWLYSEKLSEYYRTVSYYESNDGKPMLPGGNTARKQMMRWGGNLPPAINNELKRSMYLDYDKQAAGNKNKDIYTATVLPYGKNYFAFPSIYYITDQVKNDGVLFPNLYFSKDGLKWKDMGPYIDTTKLKDYNQCNFLLGALLTPKDKIYNYLVAEKSTHGVLRHKSMIYCVPKALNRYIGLTAGPKEAEILTSYLETTNNELFLNFKTESGGFVSAYLLDEKGSVIAQTDKLTGDYIKKKLIWKTDAKKTKPGEKNKVSLRLIASRAHLFGIEYK